MRLSEFEQFVGGAEIGAIRELAEPLVGKKVVHINSTAEGGGVAEILHSMIPLFKDLGIEAEWRVITGSDDFFSVTKSLHNAFHGAALPLTEEMENTYIETNQANAGEIDADYVVVHDPQPAALIDFCGKNQPWVWRCHIPIENPSSPQWSMIRGFVKSYDAAVFSMEEYKPPDLNIPFHIIHPSIDPTSEKNRELAGGEVDGLLGRLGLPEKPLLVQVSRYDRFKDPAGVLEVFESVKNKTGCGLVLAGGMADDDPEGVEVFNEVKEEADKLGDALLLTNLTDLEVNALQRRATVLMQKSLKEGFGLTVSEGLWKSAAMVASNVGGIRLQVLDNQTGFLVSSITEATRRTKELFRDEELRERLGSAGREHVRRNFLVTRHLMDYLRLLNSL